MDQINFSFEASSLLPSLHLVALVRFLIAMFAFIFEDGQPARVSAALSLLLASFFLGMDLASAYKEYRNQLFYTSGLAQTALEVLLLEKLALSWKWTRKNHAIEE